MVLDKNLNTVISVDFETSDETPFTIRVTSDDQISILDVVEHVTQQKRKACRQTWHNFLEVNSEVATKIGSFKFKGRGQNATPVTDLKTILNIIQRLPGKMAMNYRSKMSSIFIRVMGGDETLHEQIEANGSSSSGIAQMFQRAVARERDEDWQIAREKGKKMLKERQDVMKEKNPTLNRRDYAMANNRNNQIVGQFSCTTKQEKINRGLPANKPLADDFNEEELFLLGFTNAREKRKLRECSEEEVSRKKLKSIIDDVEVLVKPLAIAAK
jgi:hypothetical protein